VDGRGLKLDCEQSVIDDEVRGPWHEFDCRSCDKAVGSRVVWQEKLVKLSLLFQRVREAEGR
jgi:hypothetical protein